MYAKVLKSSKDSYWYADYIGKRFKILDTTKDAYIVYHIPDFNGVLIHKPIHHIYKEDCKVVKSLTKSN